MERWDFDCQKCGENIGNAIWCAEEWYQCGQDKNEGSKLEKAFLGFVRKNLPCIEFSPGGLLIKGRLPKNRSLRRTVKKYIKQYLEQIKSGKGGSFQYSAGFVLILLKERKLFYALKGIHKSDIANYKRAGLIKHEVTGSGWGRRGYCFCVKCAKALKHRCSLCGSRLVLIKRN